MSLDDDKVAGRRKKDNQDTVTRVHRVQEEQETMDSELKDDRDGPLDRP